MFRRFVSSALDEAFGLLLLHRVLRYRDRPPVVGRAARDFPGLMSGDPRRFFAPAPAPADLSRRREIARTPHATVEDFAFASPVRSAFPTSDVVRGRRWRCDEPSGGRQPPEGRGSRDKSRENASLGNLSLDSRPSTLDSPHVPRSRRTLVVLDGLIHHGYANERTFADVLNPAGIDVVSIDLPFNHRRTPRGYRPGQLLVGGDLDHALAALRQAVLDSWAVVRGLQAEGRTVALAGISFGGWTALSTALIADGLASVTAVAPPVDMLRVLTEGGVIVRAAKRSLGLTPAQAAGLGHVARAVNPAAWPAPLPPGRVFLHAAAYDRFVPTRRVVALARRWGATLTTHPVGHMQLTSFPRGVRRVAESVRDSAWETACVEHEG